MKKNQANTNLAQSSFNLNDKQKQAVEILDNPVIVLAGPGTGKTKLLTSKIAYILQNTDAKPDEILALTFTESATTNMKKRLSKLIGSSAYDVNIYTFHGFANYLISYYEDEYFQNVAGFRIISDLEKVQILKNILSNPKYKFKHLVENVNPFYKIYKISQQIEELKRENVTYDNLQQIINIEEQVLSLLPKKSTKSKDGLTGKYKKQLELVLKLKEFSTIYSEYQKKLQELKLLDFSDLINIVLEKMNKNQEFLNTLQERFQYILVDEYQDTNTSQNKLVFKIAEYWKDKANIFVVGDDDQAIYRFQGASVKNLLEFTNTFKSAKPIVLNKNYRSIQRIIDGATDVASLINLRINKHLNIKKHFSSANNALTKNTNVKLKSNFGLHFHEFEHQLDELNFIVNKIKFLLKNGVKPSEIAVLVRQNSQFDALMYILKLNKINFVKFGGVNIFDRTLIQQFIDYLRLLENLDSPEKSNRLFIKVLHFKFNNISSGLILKLKRAFEQFKQDLKQQNLHDLIKNKEQHQGNLLTLLDDNLISKLDNPQQILKRIEEITLFDFLSDENLPKYLELYNITKKDLQPIYDLISKLEELNSAKNEYNLYKFIHKVFKESGISDYLLSLDTKLDEISAFGVLFEHIKTLVLNNKDITLQEFLEILQIFNQFDIKLEAFNYYIPDDAIRFITVHRAKGLEFDYVFMPFLSNNFWEDKKANSNLLNLPDYVYSTKDFATQNIKARIINERAEFLNLSDNKQKQLKPDTKILQQDDERRAFYVGLTRARFGVFLSFSNNIIKQGKLVSQNVTRFVLDIKDNNITKTKHEINTKLDNDILLSLLTPSQNYYLGITIKDLDYIKNIVESLTFSATMLTTFLDDPLTFYLNYILKLPSEPSIHMSYGNAYHLALQKVLLHYKKYHKLPTYNYALEQFSLALALEPVNSNEYNNLVEKAKVELYEYFKNRFKNYIYYPLYLEAKAFITFNNINLTGKLDKVEVVKSSKNGLEEYVQIVDYKTGQPETLNAILGQTKNAKLLRDFITPKLFQLYFYKLLFDLSYKLNQNGKYIANWGVLDFTKFNKKYKNLAKPVIIEFENTKYEEFKKFVIEIVSEIKSLDWVKKLDL